jgi:hypothetical protein
VAVVRVAAERSQLDHRRWRTRAIDEGAGVIDRRGDGDARLERRAHRQRALKGFEGIA